MGRPSPWSSMCTSIYESPPCFGLWLSQGRRESRLTGPSILTSAILGWVLSLYATLKRDASLSTREDGHPLNTLWRPSCSFPHFACSCSSSHRFSDVSLSPPEEIRGRWVKLLPFLHAAALSSIPSPAETEAISESRFAGTEGGKEGLGSQGAGALGPRPAYCQSQGAWMIWDPISLGDLWTSSPRALWSPVPRCSGGQAGISITEMWAQTSNIPAFLLWASHSTSLGIKSLISKVTIMPVLQGCP